MKYGGSETTRILPIPITLQNSLEVEIGTLRKDVDNLQSKIRVGLEIETHLKKKIHNLEKKKIVSQEKIKKQISALHEHHSQCKTDITLFLDEGYSEIKSITDMVVEKLVQLEQSREFNPNSSMIQDKELRESACKDVRITADSDPSSIIKSNDPGLPSQSSPETSDTSEALALALHEKVEALLLLSQQEERHLLERNVSAALQKKIEELQRNLLQVTNEKVKALMELAQLKQEQYMLQQNISQDNIPGKVSDNIRERRTVQEKDGKLKNLLKRTYLTRWVGGSDGSDADAHQHHEKPNHNMVVARMKIENATLKESLENMEHLLSSVRRLRLSLLKVKDSATENVSCVEALDRIIAEASLVKTALSSSLPVSWLAAAIEQSSSEIIDGGYDKVDFVSGAGLEMVELLIFASQILKDQIAKDGKKEEDTVSERSPAQ